MTISQGGMTINQYFTKMKSLCSEIAQIAPEEKISEQQMRRIIINSMKPEYSSFMAAIQGWSTQPTLLELENMLANQEALDKQIAGVLLKQEDEALFSSGKKRVDHIEDRSLDPKAIPTNKKDQRRRANLQGELTIGLVITIEEKKVEMTDATTTAKEVTTQEIAGTTRKVRATRQLQEITKVPKIKNDVALKKSGMSKQILQPRLPKKINKKLL